MLRTMKMTAMAATLGLLVACGGGDPVGTAVTIAKASDKAAALEKAGLSIDQFEELMYTIAEDPELTDKFEAQK